MRRTDVAIIGGSLAGAACARALARNGIEAVAFERAATPKEKVCGGFLSPGAVECLEELDLLASARTAGAKDVREAQIHIGTGRIRFNLPGPGLGISRRTLDALVAQDTPVERGAVRNVAPCNDGYRIEVDGEEVHARVVIDASGKTSRFTPRKTESEFGVQFYEDGMAAPGVLAFWFSKDSYGGAVEVDGGQTNCCFLVKKKAWGRSFGDGGETRSEILRDLKSPCEFHPRPQNSYSASRLLVTGPLAYEAGTSPWIAIGDAAGMIDPFCGEGMRHALDTALTAADAVTRGLHNGQTFEEIKRSYEAQRHERWSGKRSLAKLLRKAARRPELAQLLPSRTTGWIMRTAIERLWA